MPNIFAATTEAEVALAAATRKCVLQIRPTSTQRATILAWGVSFDGTDPAASPVVVDFERQSTTGTGTAATEYSLDVTDPTTVAITTFVNFSAAPTSSAVLEKHEVHPQGGNLIREYPPDARPVITNGQLGISVTAPATVNCLAWVHWAE